MLEMTIAQAHQVISDQDLSLRRDPKPDFMMILDWYGHVNQSEN
jgi:hypothetical protein